MRWNNGALLAAALIASQVLAACATRPLTPAETAFAAGIVPGLDPAPVTVTRGALTGRWERTRSPRPAVACRERIFPPETAPSIPYTTAAFVLGDQIFYNRRLYAADNVPDYPDSLPLARAMLLAHELTHVWQWQNREVTGFHPLRAVQEQRDDDPYLFDLDPPQPFLDYGFEQQAALVEEFLCCRTLDPGGGRTAQLHALLAPHFPGLPRQSTVAQVDLPWPEAETAGICA